MFKAVNVFSQFLHIMHLPLEKDEQLESHSITQGWLKLVSGSREEIILMSLIKIFY